ncbi:phosphotransferase [Sporosarcina koreensis]|uniref:phosphotransferase n=1 Tax=Sporosarcina koreensis TaxID=334735 RepID=UPI0006934D1D|nr:phosphotransferase [Sporosarcina koreensis]
MKEKRETLFFEVKPHVWRLEEEGQSFAVKRYKDSKGAGKVRKLHNQLQAVGFPYIAPLTDKGTDHLIIQPWLSGTRPVDYASITDRRASLRSLDALHATREVIDWNSVTYLPRFNLHRKWVRRLERFRQQEELIAGHIGTSAFSDICLYAEEALLRLEGVSEKEEVPTILHGDVVHHNLLAADDGTVYLIDFDLAAVGSASAEIALWLHRVLPHMAYDGEQLFRELPRLQELSEEALIMLQYPNEVMREWLYFAGLPDPGRHRIRNHLVQFTKQGLHAWPGLCRFSDSQLQRKQDRT